LATRKKITVAQAMVNGRWKRGLQKITTTSEINQNVRLWSMLRDYQLTDHADEISWWFSANGKYSTRSAYCMQFLGSYAEFDWDQVWKLKAEPKYKFFGWLFLQNKVVDLRQNS
jgi:hypothetical protein